MEAEERSYLRIAQNFRNKGGDDWEVGKRLFEEVVQLYPKSADGFWELGKCYHESVLEGYYENEKEEKELLKKAIELFKEAVKLDPNDANYHFDMALSLNLQNKPKEAIEELRKGSKIDPEDLDFDEWIGMIYYEELKDYQKAADAYKDAFEKARGLIHHGC